MIAKFGKNRISKTRDKQDDLQSTVFGIIIILLIFGAMGFFLFSNVQLKQKRENLDEKLQTLQQELRDLEKQNEELKSGINAAGTESSQKEKMYEQGYVDQGAQQVVVVPPEGGQEDTATTETQNFWQKFFSGFK